MTDHADATTTQAATVRIFDIVIHVMVSTWPGFDLFAYAMVNGRQVARHGTRTEVDAWIRDMQTAADRASELAGGTKVIRFHIEDQTAELAN